MTAHISTAASAEKLPDYYFRRRYETPESYEIVNEIVHHIQVTATPQSIHETISRELDKARKMYLKED